MLEASLVVVGGEATDREIRLELPATIGRGREADVVVQHSLVSRLHCEIFERDGRLFVRDLQSLNGTFVNNYRISGEEPLLPEQLLTLGNITFRARYELAGQPVLAAGAGVGAALRAKVSPESRDRAAARPDRLVTAADLTKTVARPAADRDDHVLVVPDLGLPPVKPVSASSLHDLPATGPAVSFVGGIEGAEVPARREIDTDEIDLGQVADLRAEGVRPDDSALLNFIRRPPR